MTDRIRNHDHHDLGLAEIVGWKPPTNLTVPAYGVVKLSAFADGIFTTVKPDGAEGIYYVNGPVDTPLNAYSSSIMWIRAQPVLFDPAADVSVGDACGPVEDEWFMSDEGSGWRIFIEPNSDDIAFVLKEGGGDSGGSIMWYRIDDCDADSYYVTPTEWTGGCTDPPGKDSYNGLWTVRKLPCESPWTVDQMAAGEVHGVAGYAYPLDRYDDCTPFWKEISSCGPMDC